MAWSIISLVAADSSVSITFELPEAEQVRGSRAVIHHRRWPWIWYSICAVLAGGTFLRMIWKAVHYPGDQWAADLPLMFLFCIWAGCVYAAPWMTVRQMRKNLPIHQGPHTLVVSGAGIEGRSPHITSSLDWTLIREVAETREFLLFFTQKNYAAIVPKRVLSPETALALRHMVEHYALPQCPVPTGWTKVKGGVA